NDCDTQLWIYDDCDGLLISYDQAGAIYFDDNEGGCGQEAQLVNTLLEKDQSYYIRLGAADNSCGDSLHFELKYNGPIRGCTDSTSCNFDPFASIDDGSCLSANDPACPGAPDLMVSEVVLQQSIYLDTIFNESDNCAIEEGCLRGYGRRDILRFSTLIRNVGQQDYYVGKLSDNLGQFNDDNCHQHSHYENYAEYLIFDAFGNALPIGFKNGFCVTDLLCDPGIDKKYSCANMGITAGCQDIYLASLDCQWVDITDLPDGAYTLAIRVNWTEAPDLLGRRESNYDNNWAQVCFRLDRSSGTLQLTRVSDSCRRYTDCTGQLFGRAEIDCNGNCNGDALRGDLDANGQLDASDVAALIDASLNADLNAENCYDLNADARISVFDAALLQHCLANDEGHDHDNGLFHPYCEFPKGLEKPQDTALLSVVSVDYAQGSFELALQNVANRSYGLQLQLDGLTLNDVQLIDNENFKLEYSKIHSSIMLLSQNEAPLNKQATPYPLLRIYFEPTDADSVCVTGAGSELINDRMERLQLDVADACLPAREPVSTTSPAGDLSLQVFPNPFAQHLNVRFNNPTGQRYQLQISTITGEVFYESETHSNGFRIAREDLPKGIWIYRIYNASQMSSGKVVKL
ncbi:MAG: lysyl oxidase family protein, partial [Bacteroidota bacterium]